MIRGLYTSTLGMSKDEKRMEVISNNLANINTTGFKKDTAVSKSFSDVMTDVINDNSDNGNSNKKNIGKLTLGIGINEVSTSYKQGEIIKTNNPLDFAITGSELGFFSVDVIGKNGTQEMYTKDGSFVINSLGQLSTKSGYVLKGENGPISLSGTDISISADGSVYNNGEVVDKLLIKEFADSKAITKYGNNLVTANKDAETKTFSGQIIQGSLESSNVNSVSSMVEMIEVMRSYEANSKVLKAHDDTLQKAVNDVGRV